jgi:hypothetical protein
MTVLLVLFTICFFLAVDAIRSMDIRVPRNLGTMHTTFGFEGLGCLAQDGGIKIEPDYEI